MLLSSCVTPAKRHLRHSKRGLSDVSSHFAGDVEASTRLVGSAQEEDMKRKHKTTLLLACLHFVASSIEMYTSRLTCHTPSTI